MRLRDILLELTRRCNLKCIHCYAEGGFAKLGEELGAEDWKRVINEAASLGAHSIILTGGEPLLVKDLTLQLIAYSQKKGLRVSLSTNLTLLTDTIIDLLPNHNIAIQTSIYASDSKVHDRITQVSGSFVKTVKNILSLRARGVTVQVRMPVMLENQEYILETEQFVRDQLGSEFSAALILPVGRGYTNKLTTSKESFLHTASEKLLNAAAKGKVALPIRLNPTFSVVHRDLFCWRLYNTCWSGTLCISKDQVRVCQDCEYRYACADCPLRVLLQAGSFYEKPPWCAYNPYTGKWEAKAKVVDQTVVHRCPI